MLAFQNSDTKPRITIENDLRDVVQKEIKALVAKKNYPCVAALKAIHRGDYLFEVYSDFGKIRQRQDLRNRLLEFIQHYATTKSSYFTFFAVFNDMKNLTEDEFEELLWSELSALSSIQRRDSDKDPRFSVNPDDKNFCFSIGGKAFFVVGLHPASSRVSRRFPWPTLIFNMFEQFDDLMKQGLYEPMVQTNRQRDIKFQGNANPMAVAHGETWEAIQFSGKKNSSEWKCPFHFRSISND